MEGNVITRNAGFGVFGDSGFGGGIALLQQAGPPAVIRGNRIFANWNSQGGGIGIRGDADPVITVSVVDSVVVGERERPVFHCIFIQTSLTVTRTIVEPVDAQAFDSCINVTVTP